MCLQVAPVVRKEAVDLRHGHTHDVGVEPPQGHVLAAIERILVPHSHFGSADQLVGPSDVAVLEDVDAIKQVAGHRHRQDAASAAAKARLEAVALDRIIAKGAHCAPVPDR